MSGMIERVALALYAKELGSVEGWEGPLLSEMGRDAWRQRARAAIEEMREPTEAMIGAASERDRKTDQYCATGEEHWRAMIEEALKK